MSKRQRQTAEILRHELANIFIAESWRDETLHGLVITIASVDMSPDLKNAKVYFVAQGREMETAVVTALNKLVPYLKKLLARKLALRYMPHLRFVPDESFHHAAHIETLLKKLS